MKNKLPEARDTYASRPLSIVIVVGEKKINLGLETTRLVPRPVLVFFSLPRRLQRMGLETRMRLEPLVIYACLQHVCGLVVVVVVAVHSLFVNKHKVR
jgi:hypothetical protein